MNLPISGRSDLVAECPIVNARPQSIRERTVSRTGVIGSRASRIKARRRGLRVSRLHDLKGNPAPRSRSTRSTSSPSLVPLRTPPLLQELFNPRRSPRPDHLDLVRTVRRRRSQLAPRRTSLKLDQHLFFAPWGHPGRLSLQVFERKVGHRELGIYAGSVVYVCDA